MKKKLRHWAVRHGFANPKSTKETREIFKFPVAESTTKPRYNNLQDWLRYNIIIVGRTQ
jgi:hypothetical protein